jgi:hypothetical protein
MLKHKALLENLTPDGVLDDATLSRGEESEMRNKSYLCIVGALAMVRLHEVPPGVKEMSRQLQGR